MELSDLTQDPRVVVVLTMGGLYFAVAMIKALADLVSKVGSALKGSKSTESMTNGNVSRYILERLTEAVDSMANAVTEIRRLVESSNDRTNKHTEILEMIYAEQVSRNKTLEEVMDRLAAVRVCPVAQELEDE